MMTWMGPLRLNEDHHVHLDVRPAGTRNVNVPSVPVRSVIWTVCMARPSGRATPPFYLTRSVRV